MGNTTTETQLLTTSSKWEHENIMLYQARYWTIVPLTLSFYLVFVLLVYEYRCGKKARKFNSNHLVLFSAFTTVPHSLSQLLELWDGSFSCQAYRWTNAVAFAFGTASVYTTIWARQRKFYSDRLLATIVCKLVRVLSLVIIVSIYIAIGVLVFMLVYNYEFVKLPYGCIVKFEKDVYSSYVLPTAVSAIAVSFLFQTALLTLIIYPLSAKKNTVDRIFCCFVKPDQDIFKLFLRLALSTSICLLSSVIAYTMLGLWAAGTVDLYWSGFALMDHICNVAATVLSFVNWKQRFFPFFCKAPGSGSNSAVESF
ncbi:unnamed protein product [Clavelina lepadiformis]|uniref:G-protein coupled receptors family 1 profile domain-containing protein n=1 Tax=Clavelina lepadiformis TaxID=159417 RepID=A0ABP0EZS6_CLALP